MTTRWWVVFAACFAPLACNSTGVGNPAPAITLALVADDEPEDATGDGTSLPKAAIRAAVVVLGEIRLFPCDLARGEIRVLDGPFVVDLVSGATEPEIPPVEATPGGFCGLGAPLAPAEAPAALAGRSLYFEGVRSDGTSFTLYADMQATLRVRARDGVSWEPESSEHVFWAFRPRRWLQRAELDAAEPNELEDGTRVITIDVDRHPLLYQRIRRRLAGSSTLYADANGDRAFDPGDRDAVIGEGVEDTE